MVHFRLPHGEQGHNLRFFIIRYYETNLYIFRYFHEMLMPKCYPLSFIACSLPFLLHQYSSLTRSRSTGCLYDLEETPYSHPRALYTFLCCQEYLLIRSLYSWLRTVTSHSRWSSWTYGNCVLWIDWSCFSRRRIMGFWGGGGGGWRRIGEAIEEGVGGRSRRERNEGINDPVNTLLTEFAQIQNDHGPESVIKLL